MPSSDFESEWERADKLDFHQDTIRTGLKQWGVQETQKTGRLVPRASELHNLIARTRDQQSGRKAGGRERNTNAR
jgi:hypothetical protein